MADKEVVPSTLSSDAKSLEHSTVPSETGLPNGKEKSQNVKEEQFKCPSMGKIWIIMSSVYITLFLIALDKTIIAPAIPYITNQFNSLQDIGWYGSAYMLTLCSFQLLWGRIYTFYNPKTVFLAAVFVFEAGSAVCGAAPSSKGFIIGRAIAGMGCAGIMNGAIVVMTNIVPLEKRPGFQGLIGAVFGVASVAGPLLGGAFTQSATWRWCFYINLPCGAVSSAVLILFLKLPASATTKQRPSLYQQFLKLDPIGTLFFTTSTICVLLALQWGGVTYEWNSWRIILLLTLFAVLFIVFLATQILNPNNATLPMRILKQRTIASGFFFTLSNSASMLVFSYYIPLFFQALKNYTPLNSGLASLPLILSMVVAIIITGGLVQKIGYPNPFMIASSVISAIGSGLITTWGVGVPRQHWIGYQVTFGLGMGMGMQQAMMLAQIVLPRQDVPTGISFMAFSQNLGGAVFVSVAQNVFAGDLAEGLSRIPGLHLSKAQVAQMGATELRRMVPDALLRVFLGAYKEALTKAFLVGLALSCVSIIGACGAEWKSVKKGKQQTKHGVKKEGDKECV